MLIGKKLSFNRCLTQVSNISKWWRINLKPKANASNYSSYMGNPVFRLGRLLIYDQNETLLGPSLSIQTIYLNADQYQEFEKITNTVEENKVITFPDGRDTSEWDKPYNMLQEDGTTNKWFGYFLCDDDPNIWGLFNGSIGVYKYLSVVIHFANPTQIYKWNLRHGNDDTNDGGMTMMKWIQFQTSTDGLKWNTLSEYDFDLPAETYELYYQEPQLVI